MKIPMTQIIRAEAQAWQAFRNNRKASARRLEYLLKESAGTAFGRAHGIRAAMSFDEFRSALPVMRYSDYEHWIEKVKHGEHDVIWPGKPQWFVTTSGSTATAKIVPVTADFLRDFHTCSYLTFNRGLMQKPSVLATSMLTLGGPSRETVIHDTPVGSITGVLYKTFPPHIQRRLAIPSEVHNIVSVSERMYAIARLSLEASIGSILAIIPGSLLVLMEQINARADYLIEEIRLGTFMSLSTAPPGLETGIRSSLCPNPRRATELKNSLSLHGKLVAREIWPITSVCTYTKQGNEAQWRRIFEEYGGLNVFDTGLVASEGRVSVGLYPNRPVHAVLPLTSFVEFLPATSAQDGTLSRTLLPDETVVGERYVPVISSSNGLLRYRLDDVVEVVGFRGDTPLIEYMGRLDGAISAAGEKTCEAHILDSFARLQDKGFGPIGHWLVSVDWSGGKPRYSFLIETPDSGSKFAESLETTLQDFNVSYRRKREQGLMSPARVETVAVGSLREIEEEDALGQKKPVHFPRTGNDLRSYP